MIVRRRARQLASAVSLSTLVVVWLAQAPSRASGLTREAAARRAAALAGLGRRLFADPALSASGRVSCASCHVPDRAFGPPDGRAVHPGGLSGTTLGLRAVPSLRYLQRIPPFTRHFFSSDDANESIDNGPTGGLTWDGRVDRERDQARLPLFSAFEMANSSTSAVEGKMRAATYAPEAEALAAVEQTSLLEVCLEALEAYEQDPTVFAPYSSRYDAALRGSAVLTAEEQRGLEAFNDPRRGNCAVCHPSRPDARGIPPAFSDFGFAALGLPRNQTLPANADPSYFDLGLCGPIRTSLSGQPDYCGRFRTPTLRNVATRQVFFHNGVVHSLRDAVAFYATRDAQPERWYPRGSNGALVLFNDLPLRYRQNLEKNPPFGQLRGSSPSLSDTDIDAIVAFLETLTDADVRGNRRGRGSAP